jgi:diketogulonate reductase-like aldo/keto reductase
VTSFDGFTKALDYLQSQGYDEVDTGRLYVGGQQEVWTGEAEWQKRGLKLGTKVYPLQPNDHSPEKLRKDFEDSLKNLKADKVDILYLHAADRSEFPLNPYLELKPNSSNKEHVADILVLFISRPIQGDSTSPERALQRRQIRPPRPQQLHRLRSS